nr:C4-type zinc ribbon domain-containing protein [Microbacterium amylolyticum]
MLLDIVDLDARIERAEAARRNPPQAARVKELIARRNELGRDLVSRSNARDDLKLSLARVESDIDVARKRTDRDRDRLGRTAIARDAQALESEIASLAVRIDALETQQLDLMEQLETAEAAVAEQQAILDAVTAEGQQLSIEAKDAIQKASEEITALTRDRAAVAERIPDDLLAEYTRIAARQVGAGLFQHGTCGGCHIALSPTGLSALQATPLSDVAHCEDCGCIIIRTEESGL